LADDDILQDDDGKDDTDHTRDDDDLDCGDGAETVGDSGGNDTLVGGDRDESFVYWVDAIYPRRVRCRLPAVSSTSFSWWPLPRLLSGGCRP